MIPFPTMLALASLAGRPDTIGFHAAVVQSHTRTWLVHLPPQARDSAPLPVIIALHGAGGTSLAFREEIGLDAVADSVGAVLIVPDAAVDAGKRWAVGCNACGPADRLGIDDDAFIWGVVDSVERVHPLDRARVYLLGFSMGGALAQAMACRAPDRIAAIGVLGSIVPGLQVHGRCPEPAGIPVAMIMGKSDPAFRWIPAGADTALAFPATAGFDEWARINQCTARQVDRAGSARVEKGSRLSVASGCQRSAEVRFYVVDGLPHAWPSALHPIPSGFDATRVLVGFVLRFRQELQRKP